MIFVICGSVGIGYSVGRSSAKPIECPNVGKTLVTSSHSLDETVCVYIEPWKTKGKKIDRVKL